MSAYSEQLQSDGRRENVIDLNYAMIELTMNIIGKTVFDVDDFSKKFEKQLPRNAYFPFGAGPRVCIGNHFALMEMQLVLATIAQRVTFQMLPVQQAIPDVQKSVVIRSKEVLTMAVHRR